MIVDDIKYDADFCNLPTIVSTPTVSLFTIRPPPANLLPITVDPDTNFTIAVQTSIPFTSTESATSPETTSENTPENTPEGTSEGTGEVSTITASTTSISKKETTEEDYEERSTTTQPTTETDPPFELFIMGNKTHPLFDRRRGKIIDDTQELLCSFDSNFPCLWGEDLNHLHPRR